MKTDPPPGVAVDDLAWLADRFVLGELSPADEEAVVDRLAHDDALAAAVARSSQVVAALRVDRPVVRVRQVHPGRPRFALATVATAAIVVCIWIGVRGPGLPDGEPGPQEVVRLWRQSDDTEWTDQDSGDDEESVDGDTVPEWMLAAVGLDAASALDAPAVQEN